MLLSVDRVLQLLAEGKSIQKIAELSGVDPEDVRAVIDEARRLLDAFDRGKARKKIIIKKKASPEGEIGAAGGPQEEGDVDTFAAFEGAELSAVPLGSSLVIYTDGASRGNPGPAGIGIVIYDSDNRQVGKVCASIGVQTNNYAEYTALVRALQIARYFKTKVLRVRTDSELIVRQMKGEYRVNNENIKPLYEEAMLLRKGINTFKIEHVTRNLNDKADYLAKKASAAAKE
jgi:ribonuclease HI